MEQIDIPQERRYCSKLGFSVLAIMLWSILWQFGLYWLDGWILPSDIMQYRCRLCSVYGAKHRRCRSAGSGQAQSAWAGGLSSAVR